MSNMTSALFSTVSNWIRKPIWMCPLPSPLPLHKHIYDSLCFPQMLYHHHLCEQMLMLRVHIMCSVTKDHRLWHLRRWQSLSLTIFVFVFFGKHASRKLTRIFLTFPRFPAPEFAHTPTPTHTPPQSHEQKCWSVWRGASCAADMSCFTFTFASAKCY